MTGEDRLVNDCPGRPNSDDNIAQTHPAPAAIGLRPCSADGNSAKAAYAGEADNDQHTPAISDGGRGGTFRS